MSESFEGAQNAAAVAAELALEVNRAAPYGITTGRTEHDDDLLVFRKRDMNGGEDLELIDLGDFAPWPYRKTGRVITNDAASFAEYVNRHRDADATTLWAEYSRSTVVALLDDHAQTGKDGTPGWGQHRATLGLRLTPEWQHWLACDGRMLSQADFAEHLEDGADTIVSPAAADMLEIAQSFQAKNNVNFRSANRLDSGEVQLTYEETVQAKAGQRGQLAIPLSFELGMSPYEGGDPYRLLARFRYRLNEGRLMLGYKLIRPDVIQRAAFDDACKAVSDAIELPVIKGTPRS